MSSLIFITGTERHGGKDRLDHFQTGGADAEWRHGAVVQYAQRAMEAQRQLTVIVTGANAGGLMVRSRNLRGTPG